MDWRSLPLGKVPDAELAGVVGCSPENVSYHRRKLGIASFRVQSKSRAWVLEDFDGPDTEVARRLGVARTTVLMARRRMGIDSYQARKSRDEVE